MRSGGMICLWNNSSVVAFYYRYAVLRTSFCEERHSARGTHTDSVPVSRTGCRWCISPGPAGSNGGRMHLSVPPPDRVASQAPIDRAVQQTPSGPAPPRGAASPRRQAQAHLWVRGTEVLLALALLALTLPLMLLVALAVRLEGPGPVLRRAAYRGRAGQRFHLLSFRVVRDGELSIVGGLIHPCRIDQLPALISLLRGDVALFEPMPVEWDAVRGKQQG